MGPYLSSLFRVFITMRHSHIFAVRMQRAMCRWYGNGSALWYIARERIESLATCTVLVAKHVPRISPPRALPLALKCHHLAHFVRSPEIITLFLLAFAFCIEYNTSLSLFLSLFSFFSYFSSCFFSWIARRLFFLMYNTCHIHSLIFLLLFFPSHEPVSLSCCRYIQALDILSLSRAIYLRPSSEELHRARLTEGSIDRIAYHTLQLSERNTIRRGAHAS